MKLEPFASVDGLSFSLEQDDVLRRRGPPLRSSRNGVGLRELDYGAVVFRFQDSGRLEEITMQAPLVHIDDRSIAFEALAAFIRSTDPAAFQKAGFLVSPGFGLAFDPNEPFWVTALAAHCIDEWRAL